MLLQKYKDSELLWASNVNAPTTQAGKYAFRGDLVVVLGKMHDASQTRNPPEVLFKDCSILAVDDKWSFCSGALNAVDEIPMLLDLYGADIAPDAILILYVVNATKPMKTKVNGVSLYIQPFPDSTTWQMLMDDLFVEKSDLKGNSPADKLIIMADAAKDFAPKCDEVSFDEAKANTAAIEREVHGAV